MRANDDVTKTVPAMGDASARYERYETVIREILIRSRFDLLEAKRACLNENPAFVTRLVNELEQCGWLIRESPEQAVFHWNPGRGEFDTHQWLRNKLNGGQLKNGPPDERPRERMLRLGCENMRVAELLAILIRSGRPGESALMAGEKIANHFQDRLAELPAIGKAELKAISSAAHVTAYCQIMAGIELGRRIAALCDVAADASAKRTISSTQEAMDFCRFHFQRLVVRKQEAFHIVTLDTKNHLIDTHEITVGTLDASLVHPREVFRPAIKDAASSILLVHNHPSGDPAPSREDIQVTQRLESCGETLGIRVLDHIIVASHGCASLREHEVSE